jgi:hypothetical protein
VEITEGWSKSDLLHLIQSERYELFYCDLSLFEIYAKCMKLILQEKIIVNIETIQNGIDTIIQSSKLQRVDWYQYVNESEMILELKKKHNDSIDCMLFYLSVVLCDSFATFDSTFIKTIKKSQKLMNWIKLINPHFSIWMDDLEGKKVNIFE